MYCKRKISLQRVQKRALCSDGVRPLRHNYEEKLKELGVTILEETRHQLNMVQVFTIISVAMIKLKKARGLTWPPTATQTQDRLLDQETSSNPQTNLEIRQNFFSVHVVDSWKSIPYEIKEGSEPQNVKRLYKAHRSCCEGPWEDHERVGDVYHKAKANGPQNWPTWPTETHQRNPSR